MADVKWIRIVTDIFDDEKMYAIECMPDGKDIELIWFKILCLAGKCNQNGFLIINRKLAYTDEMLAKIFRTDLGVVQRALEVFQSLGMIEVIENVYMVSNWSKHQNQIGLEKIREQNRIRQKRFRESQKQNLLGENPICVYCGESATGVDHIIPKSKGGKDTDDNLVLCCARCNSTKNDLSLTDFLNFNEFIKKDLVNANENLMRFVKWDNETSRYITLQNNVTPPLQNNVTPSYSISNISLYLYLLENIKDEYIDYINNHIEIKDCISEWFKYKDEKKPKSSNQYQETGMKTLLKKIYKTCLDCGIGEVIRVIEESMGSNYQGIIWERLNKPKQNKQGMTDDDWSRV